MIVIRMLALLRFSPVSTTYIRLQCFLSVRIVFHAFVNSDGCPIPSHRLPFFRLGGNNTLTRMDHIRIRVCLCPIFTFRLSFSTFCWNWGGT
uniref:Putative secreted protein n=1 Tax=Anopheles darlingi TaxID=43151 RepID=A0A2M4DEV3_ANODA